MILHKKLLIRQYNSQNIYKYINYSSYYWGDTMNYEDKINQIMEINKVRSKLQKAGVIPYAIGPTGPRGKGLEIKGSYNSLEELKKLIQ